jgi:hypothetical protein
MKPKLIFNSIKGMFDVSRNNWGQNEIPYDFYKEHKTEFSLYTSRIEEVQTLINKNKELLNKLRAEYDEFLKDQYPEMFI